MGSAFIMSDKILFKEVDNTKNIANGNMSLAISEFGLFIGTGIITYASFSGQGPWYSSIVFFVLGQIVFIAITKSYEKMYANIDKKVIEGNISAGIMLGSVMIAFALILKTAIIGDFTSWEEDIESFFVVSIFGFIILIIFANYIIDKLFLPAITIKEAIEADNIAPIILLSSIKIGVALLITFAI